MARAARSVLLACSLCLACGAVAAVALAATGNSRSSGHSSHTAHICRHRTQHRHCPAARAGKKSHHKHKRGSSKPLTAKGVSKGSGTTLPWLAAPAPVIPGSVPGSGSPAPAPASGAPPGEAPAAPAGPARVQVIAKEYSLTLSRAEVPAGKVIVNFVNAGQDEHNLNSSEPAAGSEALVSQDIKPGAHPELAINLRPGSYTLYCSLPEHEAKGMKATLIVD
jgi:plastocyanin